MKILNIKRDKKGRFIRVWDRHRIKRKCLECGKEFETIESRIKDGKGKYCSKECFRKNFPSEKTKAIWRKQRKGWRHSRNTEFREGQNVKEENVNWKGGITPLTKKIRHCLKYKKWILRVFERDNYTCQKCGQRGGRLHAHHFRKTFAEILDCNQIKTFERALNCKELWDIDNGQTLCEKCHKKIHRRYEL